MKASGSVFKYGDNVDTDVIICRISEFVRPGRTGRALHGGY